MRPAGDRAAAEMRALIDKSEYRKSRA